MRPIRSIRALWVLLSAALVLSCMGDSPTGPEPRPGGTIQSIRLDNRDVSLPDGDSTRLSVTYFDKKGQAVTPPGDLVSTWRSSEPVTLTVNAGMVTAQRPGRAWVHVEAAGQRDSARVEVRRVPKSIRVVRGGGQTGVVGNPLADSIVVQLVDRHGDGVGSAPVEFVPDSGGRVIPVGPQPDSAGFARGLWILGPTAGGRSISARSAAAGVAPVAIQARATPGPAARLEKVSGDAQTGTAGAALPQPLRVKLTDTHGNAVGGASATWTVTGGEGSITPVIATADSAGIVTGQWVLGRRTGPQQVVALGAGVLVQFTAVAQSGNAAQVEKVSGDQQGGTVGVRASSELVIRVRDANGNGVGGASVAWTVLSGGGSVVAGASTTSDSGTAVAAWTFGPAAGEQKVSAAVTGVQPVVFAGSAAPGAAAGLEKVSGDAQTGTAGAALAQPLRVKVTDTYGNGVGGVAATWTIASGEGKVEPLAAVTDATGIASAHWVLGARAGSQRVTVSAASASVAFTADARSGGVAQVEKVAGDNQSGTVADRASSELVVRVLDANGNAVGSAAVTWTVLSGGGSIAAGSAATSDSGTARATWTFGQIAGEQKVSASVVGVQPAVFSAVIAPGAAVRLEKVSGDAQAGTAGAALPQLLRVKVSDAYGNGVGGVATTWTATSGEGRMEPAAAVTDAAGIASARWVLGSRAGSQQATASAAGSSMVFMAEARAGNPAQAEKTSGQNQSGTVGERAPAELAVRVLDANGNVVRGAAVTWSVVSGGGTLTSASGATDDAGTARATWTFGPSAGEQKVSAAVVGVQPAVFSAAVGPGAPSTARMKQGDGQIAAVNTAVAISPTVEVVDRFGNPVPGVVVTWAVVSGGGRLEPTAASTDAAGAASTRWVLGTVAGANMLSASMSGLPPVTFAATGVPGPVSSVSVAPASGTLYVGQTRQLSAIPADAYRNVISGRAVAWSSSDAQRAPVSASGVVTASGAGLITITATAEGRSGSATLSIPLVSLRLDGSDDYVQVPAHPALNHGTGNFTWEAWVLRSRTGVREDILSKKDVNADSEHDMVLFIDSDNRAHGFLRETLNGTPAVRISSQSAIGTAWTHLALTRSGGVVTLYVNGVAEASVASTYNITSTGPFRIGSNRLNNAGADAAGAFHFAGQIREVRVWNVARSAADLSASRNSRLAAGTPGLVAYYPLGDGSGLTAADLSGYGNHGTLRNGPAWVEQ